MKPADLVTALILLIFFIGMTINHNYNFQQEKIKKMKKVSEEISKSQDWTKMLEVEWLQKIIRDLYEHGSIFIKCY